MTRLYRDLMYPTGTSKRNFKMADVDKWIELARECKYLNETELKV